MMYSSSTTRNIYLLYSLILDAKKVCGPPGDIILPISAYKEHKLHAFLPFGDLKISKGGEGVLS